LTHQSGSGYCLFDSTYTPESLATFWGHPFAIADILPISQIRSKATLTACYIKHPILYQLFEIHKEIDKVVLFVYNDNHYQLTFEFI
jgi:hypothetical protein